MTDDAPEKVDWAEFDEKVSPELLEKIESLESDKREYEEIPTGEYEVVPERIVMKKSKNGNPMAVIWLKIVSNNGFKGQYIFANFVMNNHYGIHNLKTFIKSMDSEFTAQFDSYSQWAALMEQEQSEICGQLSYLMVYGQDKKGFKTYQIKSGPYNPPEDYHYKYA